MDPGQTAEALIVRNIGDIESAVSLAYKIGQDLWDAVEKALREKLEPRGWHVAEYDDDKVWFAPREWGTSDEGEFDSDPWFSIAEYLGAGRESDETWLAEFLAAGPSGAGVALWFRSNAMSGKRYRQRIFRAERPDLTTLIAAGFEIDEDSFIRLPIKLDAEAVAQAAADEDYAAALAPLHAAIDVMLHNLDRFTALIADGADNEAA